MGGGGGSGGDSGSVSGDNHASEMPVSLCGTNGLDVATAVPKWSVSYLDYDADTGTFTNAVRECALVTSATRVLGNGWYAVQGTVTIPAGANLSVVGTAHLILCDGATLTIPSPGKYYAAVNVSVVSSLVIYGQTDGTGALVAQGGGYGAGIGGGFEGAGGTVTINGGAVTAKGGGFSAGIGGGWVGTGGTVTINGGTVTASGFGGGPGIGDKNHKDGSMVTINSGTVTASSVQGSGVSGDTVEIDGGAINASSMLGGIRIRGGVFKNAPQSEWLAQYYKVFENPDETTKIEYPYAVMEDFIPYLDWDPVSRKMTNAIVRASAWIEVTDATRTLENGGWYVVTNNVVFPDGGYLSVNGSARLILCDGASLTIQNPGDNNAAVKVPEDASLVICGQIAGTGTLTAKGGMHSAGIGGGFRVSCGVITINGGTVTAMGGYVAAGIGGGSYGSGGTVTINGGAVTAAGNNSGSDIGPSDEKFGGTVTISGGIFARPLKGEWIADGYAIGANADSATSAAYPHAVMPAAFTVTISDNPHSTVQWTYGDGTVVTPVTGTSFKLGTGMTGVCVIFTPEHGYCFTVEGETGVRPLPSPVIEDCAVAAPAVEEILCEVTFAVGAGIRRAAYVCGGVTNELVTGETALVVRLGTRIELIVEELPRHYPFAGERTFTVEQETMRVEIFASPIPKGMEGNPFQVGADVFAATNAAGALTITGTGAMSNFVSAADVPWVPATVKKVTVDASVTSIGANAWSGMEDSVVINGTALSVVRHLAPGVGSAQPVGAISGAEFDQVQIIGGKAYLDVSVYTSDTITNQNWSVATNGVIEVPAPGKQGFFYLMSKPSTTH